MAGPCATTLTFDDRQYGADRAQRHTAGDGGGPLYRYRCTTSPIFIIRLGGPCQLVIPLDDRYDFELLIDDEMVVAAGLDDARFGLRALSSGDEGASGMEK